MPAARGAAAASLEPCPGSTGPLSAEQKQSLSKALAPFKGSYPFDVSRVILMRSSLSAAGSEYSEIASFPLGNS